LTVEPQEAGCCVWGGFGILKQAATLFDENQMYTEKMMTEEK